MRERQKYIVFSDGQWEFGFSFPGDLIHSDYAEFVRSVARHSENPHLRAAKPVRAGFVRQLHGAMVTTGRSESLGLESAAHDAKLLSLGSQPAEDASQQELPPPPSPSLYGYRASSTKGSKLRNRFKGRR